LISVLVPVKDDPRLDSLLAELQVQCAALALDTEVVVVDASGGRLDWIRQRHPDVRWIDSTPLPPRAHPIPHQRNEALAAARGDIFVFVDSDCMPSHSWLESMVTPIHDEREALVAGAVQFSGYATVRQPRHDRYVTKAGTQSLAFSRTVLDRVGYYDESLAGAHDYDFCLRAGTAGFRILFVARAAVEHPADPLGKALNHAFRYGRDAARLYLKHPRELRRLTDSHLLYTTFYTAYVAMLPLTARRPVLALSILAPYLVGRPRSVRRQVLNLTHGAGTLGECLRLVVHNAISEGSP
jgi:glycosyltransferase involved in cell wall biosynthesis